MAKKTFMDEIPVSADRFFEDVLLNDELTREMYTGALGFEKWEVISRREEGNTVVREVRAVPPQRIPSFMKKFIKGTFEYLERVRWEKGSDRCTVETEPNVMADKIEQSTVIRVEPAGEGKCRRIMEVELKVRIPLVGGKIEEHILREVEEEFEKSGQFLRSRLG